MVNTILIGVVAFSVSLEMLERKSSEVKTKRICKLPKIYLNDFGIDEFVSYFVIYWINYYISEMSLVAGEIKYFRNVASSCSMPKSLHFGLMPNVYDFWKLNRIKQVNISLLKQTKCAIKIKLENLCSNDKHNKKSWFFFILSFKFYLISRTMIEYDSCIECVLKKRSDDGRNSSYDFNSHPPVQRRVMLTSWLRHENKKHSKTPTWN